jgi:hypothetical protein
MPVGAKSLALIIAVVFCLIGPAVTAQQYSPFSDFQSLSAPELASLQAKITYLGPLDYPIESLAFTSTQGSIDLAAFIPYRRSGWEDQYGMDDYGAIAFQISADLLQAMIDSVATLPGVTDGGIDSSGYVSFALLKTVGSTKAFEAIVDQSNGRVLMKAIENAFSSDANAVRLTAERACDMSLTYNDPPTDVTSRVNIHSSGFRRVQGTDNYVATMRITNTSETMIPAPMTLLPRIKGMAVELLGESGFACRIRYGGAFLDLPVGASGLAPEAFVEVILRVNNPNNQRFDMSPSVFAGPGTR